MIKSASQFLKMNHITINYIAKVTNLSASTLGNVFRRPVSTWKVSIFQALAKAINAPVNDVFDLF